MKYGELKKVIDPDLSKDEIDICWKSGEELKWFELDETDGKYRTPKILTLSKTSDDEIMLSNPCYTIIDIDDAEVKTISVHDGDDYNSILRIILEQDTKLSFELNKISMPYVCDIEELAIDSPDEDYTKMKQTYLNNVEELYLTDVQKIADALYTKEIRPNIHIGIKDIFFHDMVRELSFILSMAYWSIQPDNSGYNLNIPAVNLVLPIIHPETVKICSVSLGYDGAIYFSVKIDPEHMKEVFDHVEYTTNIVDKIPMRRGTILGKFAAHDFTYDDSWRWKKNDECWLKERVKELGWEEK